MNLQYKWHLNERGYPSVKWRRGDYSGTFWFVVAKGNRTRSWVFSIKKTGERSQSLYFHSFEECLKALRRESLTGPTLG